MTRYIVNPINTWPLVTLNFFGEAYFEYIHTGDKYRFTDQVNVD